MFSYRYTGILERMHLRLSRQQGLWEPDRRQSKHEAGISSFYEHHQPHPLISSLHEVATGRRSSGETLCSALVSTLLLLSAPWAR